MPKNNIGRGLKFTIWHGLAVSLAVHLAFVLPFVVVGAPLPPEEPPQITLDFQGEAADFQSEQKVMEQTKGTEQQETKKEQTAQPEPAVPPPPDEPPKPVAEDGDTLLPPAPAEPVPVASENGTGANNIKGTNEQMEAKRLRDLETEKERINAYIKLLSKKVRANTGRLDNGPTTSALVAFTVLASGEIRPGSLRIAESTGQTVRDAIALKTVQSSAPFGPAPRELNLSIMIDFGKLR
ncbi:MAG: TonB family protein [Tardiphaga sp.]|nr:TonB family protein [Tardiphaga sp.]